MKCKNCKYLSDPEMGSACINVESLSFSNFVLPNDSCDKFDHNMVEMNDELKGVKKIYDN